MKKKGSAYKNRRIQSAIAGGYKRIGETPKPHLVLAMRSSLSRMWDRSIGRPCPLLCGRKVTPRLSAFCHDQALSQGGKHIVSNMFIACGRCNRSQRTLSKSEYLKLQQLLIANFGQERWVKIRAWLAGSRY
jgi:5-methylcytosine-specific restriction endonuclease McrA